MNKIVLVGGSSEIGIAIANELLSKHPTKFDSLHRLSTTLQCAGSTSWAPVDLMSALDGLQKIEIKNGDLVIVGLGKLTEPKSTATGYIDLEELNTTFMVNFLVPMFSMTYFYNAMKKRNGGEIIVLSSTAAFPVLRNNFFYGLAKLALDINARYLQTLFTESKVKITIVRSGFVSTKLNEGRKPTPFSRTSEEVANQVVKNLGKSIIWTPRVFQLISLTLGKVKALQLIANYLVGKSKS